MLNMRVEIEKLVEKLNIPVAPNQQNLQQILFASFKALTNLRKETSTSQENTMKEISMLRKEIRSKEESKEISMLREEISMLLEVRSKEESKEISMLREDFLRSKEESNRSHENFLKEFCMFRNMFTDQQAGMREIFAAIEKSITTRDKTRLTYTPEAPTFVEGVTSLNAELHTQHSVNTRSGDKLNGKKTRRPKCGHSRNDSSKNSGSPRRCRLVPQTNRRTRSYQVNHQPGTPYTLDEGLLSYRGVKNLVSSLGIEHRKCER